MFCDNCGKQNIKFAKFCRYCGNKLISNKISNEYFNQKEWLAIKENKKIERKIPRNSFEHIITRLIISSVDFFFAGIFLFIFTIVSVSIYSKLPQIKFSTFLIFLILCFIWIIYIAFINLINNGKTIGEALINIRIEAKNTFFSNLLGPLIIFDYILNTNFYIKPMKGRYFSYVVCFVLLTWWEYLLFVVLLLLPFLETQP